MELLLRQSFVRAIIKPCGRGKRQVKEPESGRIQRLTILLAPNSFIVLMFCYPARERKTENFKDKTLVWKHQTDSKPISTARFVYPICSNGTDFHII